MNPALPQIPPSLAVRHIKGSEPRGEANILLLSVLLQIPQILLGLQVRHKRNVRAALLGEFIPTNTEEYK